MTAPRFAVLVPVKPPALAKSRLAATSATTPRATCAAAFAAGHGHRRLAAARGRPGAGGHRRRAFSPRARRPRLRRDPRRGRRRPQRRRCARPPPRCTGAGPDAGPVALCADLPALRPEELDAALVGGRGPTAAVFVADAAGDRYDAARRRPHDGFDPRFGPGSRAAHLDAGADEIGGDVAVAAARRRRPRTTWAGAARSGVGPHTRRPRAVDGPGHAGRRRPGGGPPSRAERRSGLLGRAFFGGGLLGVEPSWREPSGGRRLLGGAPSWPSTSSWPASSWRRVFLAGAFFAARVLAGAFLAASSSPAPSSWQASSWPPSSWRSSSSRPRSSWPGDFVAVFLAGAAFLAAGPRPRRSGAPSWRRVAATRPG